MGDVPRLQILKTTTIVGLLVLIGAGCSQAQTPVMQVSTQRLESTATTASVVSAAPTVASTSTLSVNATTTEGLPKNVFRSEDVKVGDKIVGMTVTSIEPSRITFKGQVTLHGVVTNYSSDEPIMQGNTCFSVDDSDVSKVPKIVDDDRPIWFCFTNVDAASKVLKDGPATITIDDYLIDSLESEVWNTATFIK